MSQACSGRRTQLRLLEFLGLETSLRTSDSHDDVLSFKEQVVSHWNPVEYSRNHGGHSKCIHAVRGTNITDMRCKETPELKPRKSVAFADGQTIVDSNGEVTEQSDKPNGTETSAQSHSKTEGSGDKDVDEMTDMFANLTKKKKKKSSSSKKESKDDDDEEGDEKAEDDGEVDLSALKKKKKKSKKVVDDDFEASLPKPAQQPARTVMLEATTKEPQRLARTLQPRPAFKTATSCKAPASGHTTRLSLLPTNRYLTASSRCFTTVTQTLPPAAARATRSLLRSVCVKVTRRPSSPTLRISASV